MLGVGLALFLLEIYRTQSSNNILLTILFYTSFSFLPRELRIFVFAGIGVGLVVYGILQLNRSLLRPFIRPGRNVVDELNSFRQLEAGTAHRSHRWGTWTLHVAARAENLYQEIDCHRHRGRRWWFVGTAARDVWHSAAGDIRNCLAALSNDEQMLTQLFKYRFSGAGELDGHSFGNLFITALADMTGSFEVGHCGVRQGAVGERTRASLHAA